MISKHDYNKFKRIYDHGLLISKANKNIGFNIKLFSIKGMFDEIKKNPDKAKESEVRKMLMSLNNEKIALDLHEFSKTHAVKVIISTHHINAV
mgnify:CR=1 FL=1